MELKICVSSVFHLWLKKTVVNGIFVVGLLLVALCAGCASQKDPYGTDLPWTPTQDWERTPMLPGGVGR